MEGVVQDVARHIALAINVIAISVVLVGVVEAVVGLLRILLKGSASLVEARALWMNFARWLIAGLTFQLAADVVETAITPTWDELGQFAAIAVLRALLSYSLDRDMKAVRERQLADEARLKGDGQP